jgi:uncharacterized repeat protein (TIGR01451 family)
MVDALLGNSQAHLHPFVTSLLSRERAGETMKNKYIRRLSMTFYFVFSLLLGLAFAKTAAAVSFSAINTSPCATSGGLDSGGFCSDVGIDYSQLTGNLVTSVHFETGGSPNSLDNIDRITGARVPLAFFPTAGEVKVATVRQVQGGCTQQWPVGTVFAGNGAQIVKINPNGSVENSWKDLSAFGENGEITGLFHDRWCVSGGDLIVVTGSDDGKTGGNVWRVSESGDPVFLNGILKPGIPQDCGIPVSSPFRRRTEEPILMATIDPHRLLLDEIHYGSLSDVHLSIEQLWRQAFQRSKSKSPLMLASLLEQSTPCVSATLKGVITVPNDSKYGPWAGMIVTGDDDQIITSTGYRNGDNPKIYSINPNLNPNTGSSDCDQNLSSLNSQSCAATITVRDATGATGKALPHPEDFDFIEGDFYGVSYLNSSASGLPGQILTVPSTDFPAQTGYPDILITQEYPVDQPTILSGSPVSIGTNSGLYTVQWNASANAFVTAQLPRSGGPDYSQWEHVTFAPPAPGLKVEKHPKQGEIGSTFNQGAQVSFTIVVSNPGTGTVTNVQLSDALPGNGGLVWQTASTTQGSCANPIVGNTLNCSLGNIAPGGFVTVTVTSTATTPIAACQNQPNQAAIATEASGLTAQDSGFLTCTAPAPTQLKVEKHPKQGEPQNVFSQGSQVSFTIVVSNPGSSGAQTATGVQLTDTLPGNGGLVWQSAATTQGSCTNPIVGNALNCSLGDIAPDGAVTVTVTSTSTTPAAACQDQPNPAAVATSGNLKVQDSGFLTCTPASLPQLAVVKTPKNGTFAQGAQASFMIVVSNPAPAGSQPATNVQLTDILPGNGGLVWEGVTTTQGACTSPIAGNILSCNLGAITAGGSATVTVLSTATTPPAACTSQSNPVALATADGGLRAQDSGSLTCTPPPPQLAVVKTPKNGTFTQGSQVSFTIVVSNPAPAGAQSATNVQLTDTLPTNGGLSWMSAATTQGSCTLSGPNNSNLNCSLGTIVPQGSLTATVTSINPTPLAACQSQANPAALATADGGLKAQDSGSLNCTPPPPQLAVVKTPKNGTFTQGSQVSFTIVVSNPAPAGAQPATNVQLTDVLPGNGGLVWQTASTTQGTCVNPIVSNSLSCSLGTIPAQGSATVTVTSTATTPAAACQNQTNPAAIATSGSLTAQDSGFLTCTPPGSISLSKTPDGGTFNSGQQISFTLVASSNGPGTAQNVTLSDPLPTTSGLTWAVTSVTPAGTCNINGSQQLSCSFGNLAAGATRTVVVTTNNPGGTPAAACTGNKINNVATVSATGLPDATDSGSYTCNVCNLTASTLSVNKNNVTFSILNGNPGPATLTQVVLNWPTANGKLNKILIGSNVIYDTPDLPAPSATITTFAGNVANRTIAAGGSAVITLQFEKNADTNPGNYSGTFSFGNCPVTFPAQNACFLGYPFASNNPRTSVIFNENGVLQAIDPLIATAGGTIRIYATDEHAPLLGVRTASLPVSPMSSNPGHIANPLVGDKTIADPSGRPIFPALYITDVTGLSDNATHTDPFIRAGDWQFSGIGQAPNDVFGTWKAASVSGTTLVTDADPATKNVWNLGAGSDVPSIGFASLDALGYGTEFRWNVNNLCVNSSGIGVPCSSAGALPLQSGHTYRVQAIVHDGDQNKTGGDVGQACATIAIQ